MCHVSCSKDRRGAEGRGWGKSGRRFDANVLKMAPFDGWLTKSNDDENVRRIFSMEKANGDDEVRLFIVIGSGGL